MSFLSPPRPEPIFDFFLNLLLNSPGSKRPRLAPGSIASTTNDDHSVPTTPMVNGRFSLSPSNSMLSLGTLEEQQPTITVAMLRALTKDMKRKYVRS